MFRYIYIYLYICVHLILFNLSIIIYYIYMFIFFTYFWKNIPENLPMPFQVLRWCIQPTWPRGPSVRGPPSGEKSQRTRCDRCGSERTEVLEDASHWPEQILFKPDFLGVGHFKRTKNSTPAILNKATKSNHIGKLKKDLFDTCWPCSSAECTRLPASSEIKTQGIWGSGLRRPWKVRTIGPLNLKWTKKPQVKWADWPCHQHFLLSFIGRASYQWMTVLCIVLLEFKDGK